MANRPRPLLLRGAWSLGRGLHSLLHLLLLLLMPLLELLRLLLMPLLYLLFFRFVGVLLSDTLIFLFLLLGQLLPFLFLLRILLVLLLLVLLVQLGIARIRSGRSFGRRQIPHMPWRAGPRAVILRLRLRTILTTIARAICRRSIRRPSRPGRDHSLPLKASRLRGRRHRGLAHIY